MTAMSHQEEQEKLTFSVEGLVARDELILKSLIRLLAHRTQQQWFYASAPVDLMIIGDAPVPIEQRVSVSPMQCVLYLSQNFGSRTPYLRLPVRSNTGIYIKQSWRRYRTGTLDRKTAKCRNTNE